MPCEEIKKYKKGWIKCLKEEIKFQNKNNKKMVVGLKRAVYLMELSKE